VTFRDDNADVVLRPTGSVEVARARLTDLPTGGRTPLAAGITKALEVAQSQPSATHPPLLVLVSDGRATAGGDDPMGGALAAAAAVRRAGVDAVVVDAEDGPTRLGLAHQIAQAMAARYVTVPDLTADALIHELARS
jgi:magnesium chelatase subunit D